MDLAYKNTIDKNVWYIAQKSVSSISAGRQCLAKKISEEYVCGMKVGILLAAYGSSTAHAEHTLRAFDKIVRERFAQVPVRWAFTSLLIRERLAKARVKRDSVRKALEKMRFERFTHVVVQPLQTIAGSEHHAILEDVQKLNHAHDDFTVYVGAPLLQTEEDVQAAARAVMQHIPARRNANDTVVLMGHGAKHAAVQRYADLAHAVYTLDAKVHVGTMNGAIVLDDIIARLGSCEKVWLMPLLSVIGQHALKDMAGKQKTSWRRQLEAAGYTCEPVLHGLAEYEGFMNIWLQHLQKTMDEISNSGGISCDTVC